MKIFIRLIHINLLERLSSYQPNILRLAIIIIFAYSASRVTTKICLRDNSLLSFIHFHLKVLFHLYFLIPYLNCFSTVDLTTMPQAFVI